MTKHLLIDNETLINTAHVKKYKKRDTLSNWYIEIETTENETDVNIYLLSKEKRDEVFDNLVDFLNGKYPFNDQVLPINTNRYTTPSHIQCEDCLKWLKLLKRGIREFHFCKVAPGKEINND